MLHNFSVHPYFFYSKGLHILCHTASHPHTVSANTLTHMPPLFTVAPLTHYLTSPPHAAASKKRLVSTNEAWAHFTDGWLIPQMHQPDQSPIYCLLISALRAALLSSRKKNWFTTKIWATIIVGTLCVCVCVCVCGWVCVCVCVWVCVCVPIWWRRRTVPSSPCIVWMSICVTFLN